MSDKLDHLLSIYDEVQTDNLFDSLTSALKITHYFGHANRLASQVVHTAGSNRSLWERGSEFHDDEESKDNTLSELVSTTLMDLLNNYINHLQNAKEVDDYKIKSLIVYLTCRGVGDTLFDLNFNPHYSEIRDAFFKKVLEYKNDAFDRWISYLRKRGLKKHLAISIEESFNVFSKKSDRVVGTLFPQKAVEPEVLDSEDYEFLKECRLMWLDVAQRYNEKLHSETFMGISYASYKRRKNIIIEEWLIDFSTENDIIYLNALILD